MSGAWQITDEELLGDLERAREFAKRSRTDAAWAAVAEQLERCRHFGVPVSEM